MTEVIARRSDAAGGEAGAIVALLARTADALAELSGLLTPVASEAASVGGAVNVPRAAVGHIEQLRRLIAAIDARLLPVIDAEGLWALDGQRSFSAWLEARTGVGRAQAHRRIRRGEALRDHLPTIRASFESGELSADQVDTLIGATTSSTQRIDALADPVAGEPFLAEAAVQLTTAHTRTMAREWAAAVDPNAEERQARESLERCEFSLSPTLGGWHAQGWLDHEAGLTLRTALDAAIGRPAEDETRTRGQRNAAALVSLAHLALDAGALQKGARVRPHLLIHVPVQTAQRLAQATGRQARAFGAVSGHAGNDTGNDTGTDADSGTDSDTDAGTDTDRRTPIGTAEAAGPAAPSDVAGLEATISTTDAGAPPLPADPLQLVAQVAEHTDRARPPRACPADRAGPVDGRTSDLEALIPPAAPPGALAGCPPATFADGTPLSPHQLARHLCNAALTRIVMGPSSEPLDVGREQRIFTAAQTKAVIARDRHCQYPACNAPPAWGEIHHALDWALGGRTDIANAILLCWSHHRVVHQLNLTIHGHTDRWEFHDRNGHPHATTPRRGNHPHLPGLGRHVA